MMSACWQGSASRRRKVGVEREGVCCEAVALGREEVCGGEVAFECVATCEEVW